MRVITYNIHQARGLSGGRACLEAIASALAAREADVIACQEVLAPGADDGMDQAEWLAARTGMHAAWAPNARTPHGELGNATLTRDPVETWDNVDLSIAGFEPRGVLRTRLARGVEVWNVHLGLTFRQRLAQWRKIAHALQEHDRPVVLCGDFNDWSGRLHRPAARFGLASALAGQPRRRRVTFPAHRPWLALDRVYCRGLRRIDAGVLRGAPWSALSDHLPVEATFTADRAVPSVAGSCRP